MQNDLLELLTQICPGKPAITGCQLKKSSEDDHLILRIHFLTSDSSRFEVQFKDYIIKEN